MKESHATKSCLPNMILRFGAVTFSKRVVLSFMFKNLSELKSGKECDGLHSLAELIFDGMIVVLLAFDLKHFVFLPFKKT